MLEQAGYTQREEHETKGMGRGRSREERREETKGLVK